ncbi:hypothetical protein ACLIBG_05650 [Virgibacillus sp. W0181]|uniref:hypothetical protein n=1 Tax=Virgibacillus sp. W0181 TaxID=3391581 RepID=UPI003F48A924
MVDKTEQKTAKGLRVIDPKLFRYIVNKLNDSHNIHSYDIEALAVKEASGLTITLRYGENYAQSKEAFFSFEIINNRSEELNAFIQEAADECKEVMVADYFKMMKP